MTAANQHRENNINGMWRRPAAAINVNKHGMPACGIGAAMKIVA